MEKNMKFRKSTLLLMAGSALLPGCAFFDPPQSGSAAEAPLKIVPFARVSDSRGSAEAWYTLGRHMQRSGRLDEAANAYRRALEVDVDYTEARNGLAAISAGQGDIDQAIVILEQLNSARPEQAHVLANLGYARSLKGQYLEARIALEQAAALAPDNASIRAKLDTVLAAMGEDRPSSPGEGAGEVPIIVALADGRAEEVIVSLSPGIYELRQQGVIAVPAPVLENVRATAAVKPDSVLASTPLPTAPAAAATPAGLPQATLPQASVPASAAAVQRISERVEIINGNGVAGLARSLRALISSDWKVIRVLNHVSYTVRATRIEYAKSHYQAARQLAVDLGVEAQLRPKAAVDDVHLRVVLGHDYRSVDPLRSRLGSALALADDMDSLAR
jgi:tetratricopeptide (TPR) repeat protein